MRSETTNRFYIWATGEPPAGASEYLDGKKDSLLRVNNFEYQGNSYGVIAQIESQYVIIEISGLKIKVQISISWNRNKHSLEGKRFVFEMEESESENFILNEISHLVQNAPEEVPSISKAFYVFRSQKQCDVDLSENNFHQAQKIGVFHNQFVESCYKFEILCGQVKT